MTPYEIFARNAFDADSRFGDISFFVDRMDEHLSRQAGTPHPEAELYAEPFPQFLHSWLCVSLVSLLEQEARGYCRTLRTALELPLALSDLNGNWVDRFHNYTMHLAGMKYELDDEDWWELGALVEIRNCVVHNGGCLDGFARASVIREFVSRNGSLCILDSRLRFSNASTRQIMGIGGRFLSCVLNAAVDRFRTADSPPLHTLLSDLGEYHV
jgi:hypothetical protein